MHITTDIITIIVIANPIISLVKNSDSNTIKNILLNATSNIGATDINYTDISNYEDVNKNNVLYKIF